MKSNVYVDGFNLFYGCFKNRNHPRDRQYKWLDLAAFSHTAPPRDEINRIRYFTARVSGTVEDPAKPVRQQTYLRALRTIPNLSVHEGHFLTTRKTGREVGLGGIVGATLITIELREEKGSDVNLATHLLMDALDGDFDLAVVVSNDSDLVTPIDVVRHRFGRQVGVLNPQPNFSTALRRSATFYRPIPRAELTNCQFPDVMRDAKGLFRKPRGW